MYNIAHPTHVRKKSRRQKRMMNLFEIFTFTVFIFQTQTQELNNEGKHSKNGVVEGSTVCNCITTGVGYVSELSFIRSYCTALTQSFLFHTHPTQLLTLTLQHQLTNAIHDHQTWSYAHHAIAFIKVLHIFPLIILFPAFTDTHSKLKLTLNQKHYVSNVQSIDHQCTHSCPSASHSHPIFSSL